MRFDYEKLRRDIDYYEEVLNSKLRKVTSGGHRYVDIIGRDMHSDLSESVIPRFIFDAIEVLAKERGVDIDPEVLVNVFRTNLEDYMPIDKELIFTTLHCKSNLTFQMRVEQHYRRYRIEIILKGDYCDGL